MEEEDRQIELRKLYEQSPDNTPASIFNPKGQLGVRPHPLVHNIERNVTKFARRKALK